MARIDFGQTAVADTDHSRIVGHTEVVREHCPCGTVNFFPCPSSAGSFGIVHLRTAISVSEQRVAQLGFG
jgi:hypothetical protein